MSLPTQDNCFRNWLANKSDDDLRQALSADAGEMIRDRVREEIEYRGMVTKIIPFRKS